MGELLFEFVLQPVGEAIAYAAGFVLVPAFTLGYVQPEWPRSGPQTYNRAGLRRRADGVLILSQQATMGWGAAILVGGMVLVAVLFVDWSSVAGCPKVSRASP